MPNPDPQGLPGIPGLWSHLLDAIPANLALLDPTGTIIAVNRGWRAFARANAWPDPAAGLGQSYLAPCGVASRHGDETATSVVWQLKAVLEGTSPGFSIEYPCHSPDTQRWFTCLVAPLPMEGGTGAVVMHIDITARRLAEDRLAEVNQARYEFICALAHEVRSPLQAIIGFSEFLERQLGGDQITERQREYLSMMRQSGNHVIDVVSGVLDLAKAEAGHFELEEEDVKLGSVADFTVEMLGGVAENVGVVLRRTEDSGADGLLVRADDRALRQCLINVVSNAIKVTPSGRSVAVAVEGKPNGRFAFRVTDEGPGIAPADLERILRPFVQIGGVPGGRGRGTGLGLTLARTLMRLHGGDIEMSSAVGVGTVVHLWLPASRRVEKNV